MPSENVRGDRRSSGMTDHNDAARPPAALQFPNGVGDGIRVRDVVVVADCLPFLAFRLMTLRVFVARSKQRDRHKILVLLRGLLGEVVLVAWISEWGIAVLND
jgi:hypothetical protein